MVVPSFTISSAWSHQVDGRTKFDVSDGMIDKIICSFAEQFPVLRRRLLNANGQPHSYYNVYVDGEMVPRGTLAVTSVTGSSEIEIVPPMAGG